MKHSISEFNGGGRPPDATKEAALILMLIRSALIVTYFCGGLSTGLSTGYVYSSLSSDGFGALDAIITLSAALSFWGFLTVLHQSGIKVLPELKGEARSRGTKVWVVATLFVIAVSFPTGLLFMGEPLAAKAYFRDALNTALVQSAETIEASRNVNALISVAQNGSKTAKDMKIRELRFGSISGEGGGPGKTVDALANVETLMSSTAIALIRSRSAAAPLIRRIEALSARIRRVADAPNLSWAEKQAEAKGLLVELGQTVQELRRTAPVEQLSAAVDGLLKDWWGLGLNDQASGVMQATFTPMGNQFALALADILAEADRPLVRYVELYGFDLIAERSKDVLPIAVFVLLLDLLPVLIVTLVLILKRQDEDGDGSGSSDEIPPSGGMTAANPQLAAPEHDGRRTRRGRRGRNARGER